MDLYKESLKKVLFLDIDGVLNRTEFGMDLYEDTYGDYCLALHRPSVKALKALLAIEPDLKIAWTSDWAKTDHEAFDIDHYYLDPLRALEQFGWLSNRVVGNVFSEPFSSAQGNDRILAIEKFVEENLVESFVVLDDDVYTIDSYVMQHLVSVNPLRSFLEDDIQTVYSRLRTPMAGKTIHSILWHLEHTDTFTVNDRYECRFDFAAYSQQNAPLFTEWTSDNNSCRMEASVDVLVYDKQVGENLLGKIVLSIDNDLTDKFNAMLYCKGLTLDAWKFSVNVLSLAGIKKVVK